MLTLAYKRLQRLFDDMMSREFQKEESLEAACNDFCGTWEYLIDEKQAMFGEITGVEHNVGGENCPHQSTSAVPPIRALWESIPKFSVK